MFWQKHQQFAGMRIVPVSARAPRLYVLLQAMNIASALAYLTITFCLLGGDFIAADFAKHVMHLVYLPAAVFFIWQFFSIFSRQQWADRYLRVMSTLIVIVFGIFGLGAFIEAKQAFERPSIQTPPSPSDYWHGLSQAKDNVTEKLLGEVAVNAYLESSRDVTKYVETLNRVHIGSSGRSPHYFWDVGPAGILGPILSAYAFGVAGLTLVAACFMILVCIHVQQVTHPIRRRDVSRSMGKMLMSVPAAILCLIAFIPLNLMSTHVLWKGALGGSVSWAATAVASVALFIDVLAWWVLKDLRTAKRLAALILFLVNLLPWGVNELFPGVVQLLIDNPFPGAPWLAPIGIGILLAFANVACLIVLLHLPELREDPLATA
jgi:hypothetical protein